MSYCTAFLFWHPLFLYIRTCFIYQAKLVLIYTVLYWPTFSLMFFYAGVYCSRCLHISGSPNIHDGPITVFRSSFVTKEGLCCCQSRAQSFSGSLSAVDWLQNNNQSKNSKNIQRNSIIPDSLQATNR